MKTAALLFSGVVIACATLTSAFANEEPAAAAKPDLTKGATVAQVCASCHTSDGSRGAPAYPILQGQHADYLAKQLHDFKSGKRKNAVMSGMAAPLSDEDIRNVAAFYASKSAKPGFAKNKEMAALGEKIYRGGIADRMIPACAGCHSPTGAGIPAQYPKIGSQQEDYVLAQMLAFRSGERTNSPQMTGVAAKMNDKEIKAVSDYIAGLR
ncbi:c-type cytochrome [Paucibacter sp. R3-3]|uniref:C-type cytochrome n=1 Tax=Roseateles agri TaxID=3098619 RepID=A0ABU5DE07_9BURK|nr:c-type cytochrome [Paucibacter sp. R3-3]MDY0743973.1 c-type cytochrome [Paucibacter sp. R3-3]